MITKINLKDRTIKSYAIRKFTPRECFRLMGVREGYIDKLQTTAEKAREMFPARRLQAKGDAPAQGHGPHDNHFLRWGGKRRNGRAGQHGHAHRN